MRPWTEYGSITGLTHKDKEPFTLTFTSMGKLELPVSLHFLDSERKLEHPGRTCELHTERPTGPQDQTQSLLAVS